ncbi:hypothetical protein MTP99_017309 [Tenebrio molitor]|nr:hypothetical protein MTP99_017309 [Tenebrio molitor]
MRTIMNLIRIETQIREEWPNVLWKIRLVLNTTIQKIGPLIGIESTTPPIRAALNDLACDLSPVRNLQADRERVREKLQNAKSTEIDNLNKKRRDHVKYSVGPYEIMNITDQDRYELKRVGARKHKIIKAAKEQLRLWPNEWNMAAEMSELLDMPDVD